MTRLSVNLNKIALLRNQRRTGHPDLLRAARTAISAGAHGITVHPRQDERHIRRQDVVALSLALATEKHDLEHRDLERSDLERRDLELNVEGYPDAAFLRLIENTGPAQTTLVPDAPDTLTSDHGWDIAANFTPLQATIATLKKSGTRVALFVDPDVTAVRAARDVGADRIELYTGPYAAAFGAGDGATSLADYAAAAKLAHRLGLGVNAGHDLTRKNLPAFLHAVPWVDEVSIGHYLTVDALEIGFAGAVAAYAAVVDATRN